LNKFKEINPSSNNKIEYIKDTICVDGACQGNPGIGAYQCVDVMTNENIFIKEGFEETTNNIMEFLALVDAIKYTIELPIEKQRKIYSDSITAIAWVRNKKTKTTLKRTLKNEESFLAIEKALKWLKETEKVNEIIKNIIKWDTKNWGEIPADFGNK
jgi:ribonuclease HI